MTRRFQLPDAVRRIYEAVEELEANFPGRKFTPDGHLVGSIGEVLAAEQLKLTLHPASHPKHDAFDDAGDIQIKMIGRTSRSISLYSTCDRLVVMQIISPSQAELVYDGPGEAAWNAAGQPGKNGQRVVRLSKLHALAAEHEQGS